DYEAAGARGGSARGPAGRRARGSGDRGHSSAGAISARMSGSGLTSDAFAASKSRGGPIGRIDLHPAGGASPNPDRLRAGAPKIPSHSRAYRRRAATSQFDRTGCSKPRWTDRRARNPSNWTETSNRSNESGNGEVTM